jgi:Leucine-rich repeat (LRR) protein
MSAADDAYREAERQIAEAKRTGAERLYFDTASTKALEQIPQEIKALTSLRLFGLADTNVRQLDPLSSLQNLQILRISRSPVTDVAPISTLPNLSMLWVMECDLSDLSPLNALSSLSQLWVVGTDVAELNAIRNLSGLTHLGLGATKVADLSPISEAASLLALHVEGTAITDISSLERLSLLQHLSLDDTRVMTFTPLARLTSLKSLSLDGTEVTDLAPIRSLRALTDLSLMETGVEDLAPLASLTALRSLNLDGSAVADLRPLRALRQTLMPSVNALRGEHGITFSDTPAARSDPRLAEIAAIKDDRERTRQIFDYLETWELPSAPGDASPEPDSLLPVSFEDGRLEIAASVPTEAERDERLKRALHDRLKAKAPDLAQAAEPATGSRGFQRGRGRLCARSTGRSRNSTCSSSIWRWTTFPPASRAGPSGRGRRPSRRMLSKRFRT